jgi:hypothetical protein
MTDDFEDKPVVFCKLDGATISMDLVTMYDGRPAITGLTMVQSFSPEMQKWLKKYCRVVLDADVYLLPPPPESEED